MMTPTLFFAGIFVIATSIDRTIYNDKGSLVVAVLTRLWFMMVFADDVGFL